MIKAEQVDAIDENIIPQEIWDKLLASSCHTPFQQRGWLQAWLKTVGATAEPFFIRLWSADQIVGLIPMVIVKSYFGPIPVKVLQFAGQPQADYSDFLIAEDKRACLEAVLDFLFVQKHCWDVAFFDHLTEHSSHLQLLKVLLQAQGAAHQVIVQGIIPYAQLGQPLEEYWHQRAKLYRNIGNRERKLERGGTLIYQRYGLADGVAFVDQFYQVLRARDELKDRQGSEQGYQADKAFLTALVSDSQMAPNVHFSSLVYDGTPIAFHFGFVDQRALYYYKTAYLPAMAENSPSTILIKFLLEECYAAQREEFDFLLGAEEYKFRWATHERHLFNVQVFNAGWKSRCLAIWYIHIRPWLKSQEAIVSFVRAVSAKIRQWRR